jgi:5-methylcytosine-specific restriction endonuclease McrA
MTRRFCIGCGAVFTGTGQRCPPCQVPVTRRRNARASSSSRGLGWDWTRAKQNDAGYQAATRCQCTGCGVCGNGCGVPFTKANPKTGEHIVPRSKGGTSSRSGIPALCRRCNSSRGGALR